MADGVNSHASWRDRLAKTALDATLSGSFASPQRFLQQALQDERLPPAGAIAWSKPKAFLWLPGSSLGQADSFDLLNE